MTRATAVLVVPHDVDPVAYLRDVLIRVDTHPAAQIDDLLPHRWQPPITIGAD